MHFYSFICYPKLLDQQFAIFACSWSRWKWTLIFTFLFTFQIGALKILKEISRNCIIRKAIADLGGEEGPRASWSFQGEIVSHVAVICLVMQRFYVREACSVTAPVRNYRRGCCSLRASSPRRSRGGAGKGRRACNYVSGIWIAPLIPLWLPIDWAVRFLPISILQRLFRCRYSNSRDVSQEKITNSHFWIFLDIFGYLKNTRKNPKFGRVRRVPIWELGWEFPGWDLSHFAKFGIFMGIL